MRHIAIGGGMIRRCDFAVRTVWVGDFAQQTGHDERFEFAILHRLLLLLLRSRNRRWRNRCWVCSRDG